MELSVGMEVLMAPQYMLFLRIRQLVGMLAVPLKGRRFDAGDLLDFLSVNIYFALHDEKMKDRIIDRLKELVFEFE